MSSTGSICSCATVSTTIAGTLTGGIQDIAALLPLLGTEQCEDHVSSALTNGYLYAAVSPMSLFGSLGLARAGFKTFFASFSLHKWDIVGARTLLNMGFKPRGVNLPLIMIDPNDKDGRYLIETRLDKLVEELHLDKTQIEGVVHKTTHWNVTMTLLSAVICMLSVVPYIFLNIEGGSSLSHQTRWTFPTLRAAGGFLTTTITQAIIQRRITNLAQMWISQPDRCQAVDSAADIEKGSKMTMTDSNSPVTWFLLVLLLLGILASVVGYVGCFSVVQSAKGLTGPLSWVCLEAGLSLLRMFLWGYNPTFDDAPPLELVLKRDADPPLPTCNAYNEIIMEEKVLPLTRTNQFLNSITSFTGVVNRFDHPDVTLYYTLTRKGLRRDNLPDKPDERILYLTIFDHKERSNTRVYTQNDTGDHFYSTESSLPVIDAKLGLLQIKLGDEIDTRGDLIASDNGILSKLRIHYRSILDQLRFTLINAHLDNKYRIENTWTMALADTTSALQERTEKSREDIDTPISSCRDLQYLQQGQFERIRRSLTVTRGQWVESYMRSCIEMRQLLDLRGSTKIAKEEEDKEFTSKDVARGKRNATDGLNESRWESHLPLEPVNAEMGVIEHLYQMELLLAKEAGLWEEQLSSRVQKFASSDNVLEKERLRIQMEWRTNCRQRFDDDTRIMNARLDAAKLAVANGSNELTRKWQSTHDNIKSAWQTVLEQLIQNQNPAPRSSSTNLGQDLNRLRIDFQQRAQAIEAMIGLSGLKAMSLEQLQGQSDSVRRLSTDLEHAIFCMDHPTENFTRLTEYKFSRSKMVDLDLGLPTAEVEVCMRALKATSDVIFIAISPVDSDERYALVAELIRNMPSVPVTSIRVPDAQRLPAIQRDTPLMINDQGVSNNIEVFLHSKQLELARTRRTYVFIGIGLYYSIDPTGLGLSSGDKIAVSFFGPPSGNLVLALTHGAQNGAVSLTLINNFEQSHGSHIFQHPVPSLLTTETITLFPSPSDHLSFAPNTRNNLIIEVTEGSKRGYVVQNIRLHDEAGNDYHASSPEAVTM